MIRLRSTAWLAVASFAAQPLAAGELLPPGIRPERTSMSWVQPTPVDAGAARRVELIGSGDASDWLQVEYTVDPDLEAAVRAMLAERGVALGHVVLLDPASGEVYAYVSTDPERFPATRAYPMASLMKVVTAAAALRHAPAATERDCRYRGNPYRLEDAPAVWPPERAARLRELLVEVTAGGTARGAFHGPGGAPRLGPVRVAGKTGTLSGRDPDGLYQWFIGLAPAEAPRVAIAALVVHEGTVGASASEVAASALEALFCGASACEAARVGRLRARARRREEAVRREIAAERESRARLIELDSAPRPIDPPALDFPRALRRRSASGTVVLLLDLDRDGAVRGVEVESSDLPDFDAWVISEVEGWRFTPPTVAGRPVDARARLPLPIRVE